MNKTTQTTPAWRLVFHIMRYDPMLYAFDALFWVFIMGLPAVPGLAIHEFFNTLTGESPLGWSPWAFLAILLALAAAQMVVLFCGRFTKSQARFTTSGLVRRNLLEKILERPAALEAGRLVSDRFDRARSFACLQSDFPRLQIPRHGKRPSLCVQCLRRTHG